ncbi:unnamed protein product (macronuclear) [Paramecium tetraurelia]|uniref:Uncharacterized protein n=1 Tax=Paramecium tetraurelia TaxID=5888 RepID=A0BTK7_PARTE|nr:uncharacterized protein GSPATT00032106001 [Paramecium tetraurelia]CAK61874.1 unnamed protein product [Paramecium tetraurelia]|eukprot:XP_001429272.1 hypothetical protein (macronuclear) [Paramecium tetraurelia strain d4-2]
MNNRFENSQDHDLDMCGISRSYSQTKLPNLNNHNKDKLKNEFVDKKLLQRKDQEDLGGSIQLNDLNILGLKDYYSGACDNNNQEIKLKQIEETNDCTQVETQQNEPYNNTLDQLGQKLNEVIGQYLCELTSQSRLSLDSFSLQNSENLDEEQQQQILDLELNVIRQRIYKQIVDKINLSVIQSVQSIGTSSQLTSQSNYVSTCVSKELLNNSVTQFSQISQKSPPKSLTHSLLDLQSQLYQSAQQAQARPNKKVDDLPFNIVDCEGTKEELQNKLKISIQLNYQQSQINSQLREELSKYEKMNYPDSIQEDETLTLQQEIQNLRLENAKLKESQSNKLCEKCKDSL